MTDNKRPPLGQGKRTTRDAPTKPMPPLTSRSIAEAIHSARIDERRAILKAVLHFLAAGEGDVGAFLREWLVLVEAEERAKGRGR